MVEVQDLHLKAPVFLCIEQSVQGAAQRIPRATGFLVRIDLEGTTVRVEYLVTARHCLQMARSEGATQLWMRANLRDGTSVEIPGDIDVWYESDNADVAAVRLARKALPENLPGGGLDHAGILLDAFVGPGPSYRFVGIAPDIGAIDFQPRVGHEIYVPGLFTQHYGKTSNLPVARFGHIARMPNQIDVQNPDGSVSSVVAYLAEVQSWGGQSGSPVFALYPVNLARR